jgi:hypothetical protein
MDFFIIILLFIIYNEYPFYSEGSFDKNLLINPQPEYTSRTLGCPVSLLTRTSLRGLTLATSRSLRVFGLLSALKMFFLFFTQKQHSLRFYLFT